MKKLHDYFYSGYTLIELLIAVSLSLLLLLGVTEMFRHVGSTMSDTQKSLNMSANLNATAMTLRSDLGKLALRSSHLAKPSRLLVTSPPPVDNGYLEIVEGMNAPYSLITGTGLHVSINQVALSPDTGSDLTVGDVDDILAFTAESGADYQFRGLINGSMGESSFAEIIWFVRGTTLYRRVLLIDQNYVCTTPTQFYEKNDVSVHFVGTTPTANSMSDLVRRENRFAHTITNFPFPLYNSANEAWYYLRMPTLEETVSASWPPLRQYTAPTNITSVPYWDFWQNPNGLKREDTVDPTTNWQLDPTSGSLANFVTTPRQSRAGEDIVLKNVISFDVKVWNPYWVPCVVNQADAAASASSTDPLLWAPPQYVDLGQDRFILKNASGADVPCFVNYLQDLNNVPAGIPTNIGYGFTLKGRYNTTTANRRTVSSNPSESWHKAERLSLGGTNDNRIWNNANFPMLCFFDSWTTQYEDEVGTAQSVVTGSKSDSYVSTDPTTWRCPPPYSEDLKSIQITIRCFERQSGHIKQVRVVQNFPL
ncbi:MAG: hypothetical protein LBG58_01700 [Planctomycetaceae bacterium]|nr:hypothetical protein [Planctomycetaceae bacterium]